MLNNDERTRAASTIEQAAEWFVRLQDGEFSQLEYECYLYWLNESPAHVVELCRLDRLHRLLRRTLLSQ